MKKKKSIILLIALTFIISYSIFSITTYLDYSNKKYEIELNKKVNTIKLYFLIAQNYLSEGLVKELEDRLEQAKFYKEIDFYILQHDGFVIYYGNVDGRLETINKDYKVFNKVLFYPNVFFSSLKINGYVLTVGHTKYKSKVLYHIAQKDFLALVKDLILVVMIVVAISFFYLKDLQGILMKFSKKGFRSFSDINASSYEVDLFLKGLKGYERNIEYLKNKADSFSDLVLPALHSELASGKELPYNFSCTMVLTDINNYSEIYNSYEKSQFIRVIKEFFLEATHIISKHGGLVYKFVGDEVIYYFKDEDHLNSAAIALSAVSELNVLTQRINEKYNKLEYQISIKSALSHGQVTLDSLINSFELFGTNIIECARILAHVHDKGKNTIFYGKQIKDMVDFICEDHSEGFSNLKGIKESVNIYSYINHKPIEYYFQNLSNDTIDKLYYYRKDEDIVKILMYMNSNVDNLKKDIFVLLTSLLKRFTVTKTSENVYHNYLILINTLNSKFNETGDKKFLVFLSSAIMMCINIISKDGFHGEIVDLLKGFLSNKDKRVIANTLDVFVNFDSANTDLLFDTLLKTQNNRILANAIIKSGMLGLSQKVVIDIDDMLCSDNPYFVSSGIYAIGELSKYHKEHDIVYFNTNIKFYDLVLKLKEFIKSDNEMVRRQAFIAARKIDDEKLNKAICEMIKKDIAPIIRTEILRYFVEPANSFKEVA